MCTISMNAQKGADMDLFPFERLEQINYVSTMFTNELHTLHDCIDKHYQYYHGLSPILIAINTIMTLVQH